MFIYLKEGEILFAYAFTNEINHEAIKYTKEWAEKAKILICSFFAFFFKESILINSNDDAKWLLENDTD